MEMILLLKLKYNITNERHRDFVINIIFAESRYYYWNDMGHFEFHFKSSNHYYYYQRLNVYSKQEKNNFI